MFRLGFIVAMPPIFEERAAWFEEWAAREPEPDRSRFLKICAYSRAERAYLDRFTEPDADPQICSVYLDLMIDAVKWVGITDRYWRLLPILGMRLKFKDYQPKKRLSWRSGLLPLMYAVLKGPLRDGVPYISASEFEKIKQLTRTPESEERLERARIRASTPSEYNPPPLSPQEQQELAAWEERQRPWRAYTNAGNAVYRAWVTGDERECDKQLDIMIECIREVGLQPFYRSHYLQKVWKLRRGFRTKYPNKHLKGRSRWFFLALELFRGPWRAPEYIRNPSKRTGT